MTVREANLTAASSADREPEIVESGGTARLHLTLAITDYDHVRDLVNGVVRAEGTVFPTSSFQLRKSSTGSSRIVSEIFRKRPSASTSAMPRRATRPLSGSRSFHRGCSATPHSTCAATAVNQGRRIWKASASELRNGRKPPASMRADFCRRPPAWICGRANGSRLA